MKILIVGIYVIFASFTAGWAGFISGWAGFISGWDVLKLLGIIALSRSMSKALVPGNEHIFFTEGCWRRLFCMTLD